MAVTPLVVVLVTLLAVVPAIPQEADMLLAVEPAIPQEAEAADMLLVAAVDFLPESL